MDRLLLVLVGALVVAVIACGVAALITGSDPGLSSPEPDGQAASLPLARPLVEEDFTGVRFNTALRGYRMAQVDAALRRTAYDIGYKHELIAVLEAEVAALREGRLDDAEVLRRARETALGGAHAGTGQPPEADAGPVRDVEPSADAVAARDAGTTADATDDEPAAEPVPAAPDMPAADAMPAAKAGPAAETGEDVAAPSPVGSGWLSKHRGSAT
jgi:DivIVA domain-containing protein